MEQNRTNKHQTICECGESLNYRTTPFKSVEVRVCPKCGRHHNVYTDLIDWDKLKVRKNED